MLPQEWAEPHRIRSVLDEIYRRPEFRTVERRTLLERLVEWLSAWFGKAEIDLSWIRWGVYAALAALVLVLLWHWIPVLARRIERRAARTLAAAPEGPTPEATADWESVARDAASRGDYLGAVRALYRHAVVSLDRRSVVRFHESKTGGDYLRECRHRPELAEVFGRFLSGVERVLFGGQPCGPSLYRELEATAETVVRGRP